MTIVSPDVDVSGLEAAVGSGIVFVALGALAVIPVKSVR